MLAEFTTPFIENKDNYLERLAAEGYPSYERLLELALEIISEVAEFGYGDAPDPALIHPIDDGDYQGTKVFVVGSKGYQPDKYWVTTVGYGSCSGCDALENAWGYGDNDDYEAIYTLVLHMLQRMRVV